MSKIPFLGDRALRETLLIRGILAEIPFGGKEPEAPLPKKRLLARDAP